MRAHTRYSCKNACGLGQIREACGAHNGEKFVRNRGYRFILKDLGYQQARCALCINSTWINQLLLDYGIEPKIFRKMSWESLYGVQSSDLTRQILKELRPTNFWQMCDAVALPFARYESFDKGQVFRAPWFRKYPILVIEDVYEILLEEGYSQMEALEITDCFAEHNGRDDRRDLRDLLELYDVNATLCHILLDCRMLPPREHVIRELISQLTRVPVLVSQE